MLRRNSNALCHRFGYFHSASAEALDTSELTRAMSLEISVVARHTGVYRSADVPDKIGTAVLPVVMIVDDHGANQFEKMERSASTVHPSLMGTRESQCSQLTFALLARFGSILRSKMRPCRPMHAPP